MDLDLRYPIGKFTCNEEITEEQRLEWIKEIAALPMMLNEAVRDLNDEQLDTPYREGGWTLRQVVHHVADSHMNSFIRFKLALTEEEPVIKPYFEDRWAELQDSRSTGVEISLSLLEALHKRWVILLKSFRQEHFRRTFFHPESKQIVKLDYNLGLYAWHGKHHTAHITSLRNSKGW
jgi:uncharacterized damage-inducible protein DinB